MTRLGLVLCFLLLVPGTAQAAERWASPSGSGTECGQAAPCAAAEAFSGSAPSDEIVLVAGTYELAGANLVPASGVTVRGQDATAAPVLRLGGGSITVTGELRDVDVRGAASGPLVVANNTDPVIERVLAVNDGAGHACRLTAVAASVTDTACIAPDATALRIESLSSALLANVTAHGDTGLSVSGGSSVDVHNAILFGASNADLIATDLDTFVTVGYSQLQFAGAYTGAEIVELDGNISEPAALLDPEAGDVRQHPSSSSVDAGRHEASSQALGGLPRVLGDAPDVGASELPHAPRVFTGPAHSLRSSIVRLEAVTEGRGLPGTLRFEYGPTAAYGSVTSDAAMLAGFGDQSATVTGLTPGTTYHYRAVATHAGGTSMGRDAMFTTRPGSADQPPTATDTIAPVILRASVVRSHTLVASAPPNAFLLTYSLSEPAFVLVTVERGYNGRRRKGGSCHEGARRGRRCRTWRIVEVRTQSSPAGPGHVLFRRGLKPGRYRFTLRATDQTGNGSATVRLAHRVRRG